VDSTGNVYVSTSDAHTIRKVTPEGVVMTLAGLAGTPGSADGVGSAARFNLPVGLAVDGVGNIYVAEVDNHTIRKITPVGANWVVTTIAGQAGFQGSGNGTGTAARFNFPGGVAVDSATNIYVADTWNHTIRKVTPARVVTTLAGLAGNAGSADGTGTAARFNHPSGVAVDTAGNVYVADTFNNTIRKVTPVGTNWVVRTLGGEAGILGSANGTGSATRFSNPNGVAVDSAGNLYVADFYFNTIRKGYPPRIILNSGFIGGEFGFNLTGPLGQLVIVEASPDLVGWQPI
jgi:sugar lactone lactonase YvrE